MTDRFSVVPKYSQEDLPVGTIVRVEIDGALCSGRVDRSRSSASVVAFDSPVLFQGREFTRLWVPNELVREVLAVAQAQQPPLEAAIPVPDHIYRPCKHCGQQIDVTGLTGKAIGSALGRHIVQKKCPAASPRKTRRRPRKAGPETVTGAQLEGSAPSRTPTAAPVDEILSLLSNLRALASLGLRFRFEITNEQRPGA